MLQVERSVLSESEVCVRASLIVWAVSIAATAYLIAVAGCDKSNTPGKPVAPAPLVVHEPEISKLEQIKPYFQVDEARPDNPVVAVFLSNTRATDKALEHLKGLVDIKSLALNNTEITDAGLVHLSGLVSLEHLYLNDTAIGDVGLEHIRGLANIRGLDLRNTEVSDTGLECLSEMTELELLDLTGTDVTELGVKDLQQLLPKCVINLAK